MPPRLAAAAAPVDSTAYADGTAHPDSDAPFVNGGAVYADTETVAYRPTAWPANRPTRRERGADDGEGPSETTSRLAERRGAAGGDTRARHTEQIPRLRSDRTSMLDPGRTGPIALPPLEVDDDGPSTAVGLAPAGAEAWHRERTGRRAPGTQPASAPRPGSTGVQDDGPATEVTTSATDDLPDDGTDRGPDRPAGLADLPAARRDTSPAAKGPASAGQAWAAVVAQWIAGAIGGAALWVGFRFLWRDLPVVAVAAAALVTVGLVLVVRALMRNDDRRTTMFAVLVGLLLTVSPAILVLLGR